jgi:hypothetical protein
MTGFVMDWFYEDGDLLFVGAYDSGTPTLIRTSR